MGGSLSWLAWSMIGLLSLKYCIYLLIAKVNAGRKRLQTTPIVPPISFYNDTLTVLIPAYNEEVTVAEVVNALLHDERGALRIIIIDDGSSDRTLDILQTHFAGHPRVTILSRPNGGKSAALNYGLQQVTTPFVSIIDADTVVRPGVLFRSLSVFDDPLVGAVSGNILVGNATETLPVRWQKIEYLTLNYEKYILQQPNWIAVIPGALGIFRTSALYRAGGFHEHALTEDYDLTVRIIQQGYKVKYLHMAKGQTEVPASWKALYKQRRRWIYGNLQSMLLHRKCFYSKQYHSTNRMALLLDLVYNKLMFASGCLLDITAIVSLVSTFSLPVYYGAYLLIDSLLPLYILYRHHAALRNYIWLLPQRLVFRGLTTITMIDGMITLLLNGKQKWNKLARTGNFTLQEADSI
ncbi:glycosyltransferase [Chitinophaga pendula]|uniref:glycosyltransferase n=1 Tax=Chitinophaga TaxID=79328 RepID=UPI000BAFB91E|nr:MULTISPECIES: glycosyltransferase [Chitinophaga]ASZ09700.1 hypothetical protein CK934_01275 [Chitinophaga sp. MD30]UCJ07360.1 glycosyltransferase [Chitinophaga pendula]